MRKVAMRKRASRSKPIIIGDILHRILKKKNIPHTAKDRRLLDLWTRAVGPQIAARTLPETVKRGTLHVRVSAPVWLHQLQFLKEEILHKLNELSEKDEVQNLFFTIGEIPSPARESANPPPAFPSLAPLRKRDREMIRENLNAVRDPELREIMERVMSKEISRRRERDTRKET
jgi:hypothetical protein